MIYLASPYSHPDPLIRKTRFLLAEQCVGMTTLHNRHIYSPIVHFHELAQKYKWPTDFAYWKQINFDMIRRAEGMYGLNIEGWKESVGVTAEVELARTLFLPIQLVSPDGDIFTWLG